MDAIRTAIYEELQIGHPMTVRQVFYALTTMGAIRKTEGEYKSTVCRLLADMRRSGEIPYEWIADSTRWMRKPQTHSSIEEALQRTASTYRRSLWDDSPDRVEVWLEKEALAGVVVDVTDEWDVPLMVTRGYPSISFLYSAAASVFSAATQRNQRTHIYYFGDRDPSGVDIDRTIQQGIGEGISSMEGRGNWPADRERRATWHRATFDGFATFERIAITPQQIEEWELPSRPTKNSDSRSKSFRGESVELDALPASTLRKLARKVIERHVDERRLDVLRVAEADERRVLEQMASTMGGSPHEA